MGPRRDEDKPLRGVERRLRHESRNTETLRMHPNDAAIEHESPVVQLVPSARSKQLSKRRIRQLEKTERVTPRPISRPDGIPGVNRLEDDWSTPPLGLAQSDGLLGLLHVAGKDLLLERDRHERREPVDHEHDSGNT